MLEKSIKQKKHQIFPGMALAVSLLFFALPANGDTYDFYVDAASSQAEEKGTDAEPFKTVTAALSHIRGENLNNKNVYIRKGTYAESVELTNDTNLVGEERHETAINAAGHNYGIYFHATSSRISNLTVENASVNLKIDKKSKVTITSCSIKDSGSNGLEADKTSHSKKYMLTIKNSSVKDSGKRGMYIFKRKIEISGNEIESNDEEGIDLHTSVKGDISGNIIRYNDESGIEMVLAGASVNIKGNNINGNKTQGISIQVYNSQKGKIKLTRNHIEDNSDYGIRYARYDHGKLKMKFRDFLKKCVKKSGNTISGNGDGDYGY